MPRNGQARGRAGGRHNMIGRRPLTKITTLAIDICAAQLYMSFVPVGEKTLGIRLY